MKRTIRDVDVEGKVVLVRADFNVPLAEGKVADDMRVRAALPTIRGLLEGQATVVLCSHLGRPGGEVVERLRLDPVAARLSELLGRSVDKVDDCVGPQVTERVGALRSGELLLLENTRFHPEEKKNDPRFAKQLAEPADLYVNDAFAAAHRAHASTEGVARYLPAVAGLLMEKELSAVRAVIDEPEPPLVAILGGAKISDKIGVVESLLTRAEWLLVGGGIANTLLAARGEAMGASLVDEEGLETAARILKRASDKLVLPVDAVIAEKAEPGADWRTVSIDQIPTGWKMLDIGPRTVERYRQAVADAKTVVWNGPMGVFEVEPFAEGTFSLVGALAELDAKTIVGGGETAAAVARSGNAERFTHVSTGGGAFLAMLEGEELPGVAALQDR